jgi:hypothetical protein
MSPIDVAPAVSARRDVYCIARISAKLGGLHAMHATAPGARQIASRCVYIHSLLHAADASPVQRGK